MAELKKISELKPSQVDDNTEFLLIDESLGKTNRVSFSSLKDYLEQTGEKGRLGDAGIKGQAGQPGPRGLKGMSANDGPKGFSGEDGSGGEPGIKGIKGVRGVKGGVGQPMSTAGMLNYRGDSGDVGDSGDSQKGSLGSKGSRVTGAPGDLGSVGESGENSPNGPKGPKGLKGLMGLKGLKGSPVASADRGESGRKGSTSSVVGPAGPVGSTGVSGTSSQYKFNFYHDLNLHSGVFGFKFTEGSTLPSYSNDEFVHMGGGMRGTNNRFQKISGGNAWNAGIKSKSTKSTSIKAWGVSAVPNITQQTTMIGLSLSPTADYHSLDYAFYFSGPAIPGYGSLYIYEKGTRQAYGEESGKILGINPTAPVAILHTPGMQYHIDWDGVNKRIIYRASNHKTGEIFIVRIISCPWVNKNVYAAGCFYQGTTPNSVDATRYVLWR